MKRSFAMVGLLSLGLVIWSGCATTKSQGEHQTAGPKPCSQLAEGKSTDFGEPMKLTDKDTLCLGRVLSDPSQYDGQYIRVGGKVDSVCAKKGCWMRLAACKGETVFVKFTCPIKGRLIPMEAAGKRAVVEGTLEVKEISEEEARHYAEDDGASPEEIAKIVGPQKTVRISSPAARIADL